MMRSPDFFCIGAQKAGTTWLHAMIRSHPSMWLPPVKELQYFNQVHVPQHRSWTQAHRDDHAMRNIVSHVRNNEQPSLRYLRLLALIADPKTDDNWYRRVFDFAPKDNLCADMTPEYSLLPDDGIAHLLSINPSAKIIFLLRDPIDRCWSHVRMINSRTNDDIDLAKIAQLDDVLERANYPVITERWRRHVDEKNLFVGFFDDIVDNPHKLLGDILEFLGVERSTDDLKDPNRQIHKGAPLEIPQNIYQQMRNSLAPVYEAIAAEWPERGGQWMADHDL